MSKDHKKGEKPELNVLTRSEPEGAVLAACKSETQFALESLDDGGC